MNNYADITKKSVTESTKGGLQKKESKLRDIGPKGREGSEKNQFFPLIRKRENYLGGEGLNPKVSLYLGILLVNFEYFCKSAYHQLSKISIFFKVVPKYRKATKKLFGKVF